MMRPITTFIFIGMVALVGNTLLFNTYGQEESFSGEKELRIRQDEEENTISVFRSGENSPILVQNARENFRPYIHPIVAPDGNGLLTEYRPSHHLHQTGLYWGLKMVNGRDFFMNWEEDYWNRVSAKVIEENGPEVKWQTIYDMLDEDGNVMMTETQTWSMQEHDGKYILDLEWTGEAKTDITFGEFYVGGLFLRMPWKEGDMAEVVNAVGQKNLDGEQQRAIWSDVGIQVEGREDLGHIAMLDHPNNRAFPTPWRVDSQFGVGPSIQILGDWGIDEGERETIRYRLVVYTGKRNDLMLNQVWKDFVCEY